MPAVDRTADLCHAWERYAEPDSSAVAARLAPSSREPFTAEAGKLIAALHRMERFLRSTFPRYVNPLCVDAFFQLSKPAPVAAAEAGGSRYYPKNAFMSDADREEFDNTMENFARRCSGNLSIMRNHAESKPAESGQQQEHRRLVAQYLETRVMRLMNVWQKMISLRAKELMRATVRFEMGATCEERDKGNRDAHYYADNGVDDNDVGIVQRRCSRQERRERRKRLLMASMSHEEEAEENRDMAEYAVGRNSIGDGGGVAKDSFDAIDEEDTHVFARESCKVDETAAADDATADAMADTSGETSQDTIFLEESPDDVAALRADAAIIERALETDVDAAQELEKQFANLAEMTKMFTQSVDEQHEMVNSIQEDTDDAKDFLDKGVEELNKASVGQTKHFLSIIFVILSFVLLFLDWFTP